MNFLDHIFAGKMLFSEHWVQFNMHNILWEQVGCSALKIVLENIENKLRYRQKNTQKNYAKSDFFRVSSISSRNIFILIKYLF